MKQTLLLALAVAAIAILLPGASLAAPPAGACDLADSVAGGGSGTNLGWDVGSGQCNGSFTTTTDSTFPGGAIELGLRGEKRTAGQVANAGGDYTVQTGLNVPGRAWWNVQGSVAYEGELSDLDALTLSIITEAGPNLPTAPSFDLLALRPFIDDRNLPKAAATFTDIYQISQNPCFASWFGLTPGVCNFDVGPEGAWLFTLTATQDGHSASVGVCIHTPLAECSGLRSSKEVVHEALASLFGSADKKDQKHIAKAIEHLNKSLDVSLWDGDSPGAKGKKIFDEEKKAVEELEKVKNTDVSGPCGQLVAIDSALAQAAINDAVAGGGNAKEIDKANKEMDKAAEKLAKSKKHEAVDHYKHAWEHAQRALK